MAYNPYQPQFYPTAQPMQYPVQQNNNGIIWVQGENAAKAYPVAAGQSALLMDSENSVFYIKSTDQSGMPQQLRIFDYKERVVGEKSIPQTMMEPKNDYISREEFDKFKLEIKDEIRRRRKPEDSVKESKNA